jgi:hypothetical protein
MTRASPRRLLSSLVGSYRVAVAKLNEAMNELIIATEMAGSDEGGSATRGSGTE